MQTGRAASVRAGELNECSRRKRQIETAKEPAIATHASEFANLEYVSPILRGHCSPRVTRILIPAAGLDGALGSYPFVPATLQDANARETAVLKNLRRGDARLIVRTRTISDDLAIARQIFHRRAAQP